MKIDLEELLYITDRIASYGENLKVYKKAFELACNRLGKLEHTCDGCIAEACENYINDDECSKIIMSKYLQKAREEND